MSVLTLDLLRHGDAEDDGCYRGRTDSALTALGERQMLAYAAANPGWQRVLCSPLRRCAEPARQIAQRLTLECAEDARLLELDFGRWDGRPYAQVWQQEQAAVLAFWQDPDANPPPGGESLANFRARLDSLQRCLQQRLQAGNDAHVLLLTHGGVVRALLGSLLGMEARHWSQLRIDTASLSRIRLGQDGAHRWCEVAFMNRIMAGG
ncbi:histidine phosphatase family protein [Marinobacterium rhizophilum]|uniref:Histidine phosphatase family protein n=1 Tax=Marinobacterium rhizophilum TaxID=420402 RepID=A0ABY5HRY1_9GAMM|nr:histidine phosphatase family protein [Marinobacterium rhizophilum]UTW13982.1 histidine phosphatase family protein [Marinobacterium rhizophilum]